MREETLIQKLLDLRQDASNIPGAGAAITVAIEQIQYGCDVALDEKDTIKP